MHIFVALWYTIITACAANEVPNDSADLNPIASDGSSPLSPELLADGTVCSDSASQSLRVRQEVVNCVKYMPGGVTANRNRGNNRDNSKNPDSGSELPGLPDTLHNYYEQIEECYSATIVCGVPAEFGPMEESWDFTGFMEGLSLVDADLCLGPLCLACMKVAF